MSERLTRYLSGAEALSPNDAEAVAGELGRLSGTQVYPKSVTADGGAVYFLGKGSVADVLGVVATDAALIEPFDGQRHRVSLGDQEASVLVGSRTANNAALLRQRLDFLVPKTLGLQKSIGCGDRLGFATPGHIRALRSAAPKGDMALIAAQQSIRENARTGRNPQIVMDDALWGVLREGWRSGFGADADHLKTEDDVASCVAAGYTFFTFDPGDHVENEAESYDAATLSEKMASLPWDVLETSREDCVKRLTEKPVDLGTFSVSISEEAVHRALVKYGRAVAHIVKMYRHLKSLMGSRPFELEVSVDETESVTMIEEHIYIASELQRLGVEWVSLAPRYVGSFEKGVDYIGDLDALRKNFEQHVAVAKAYGPYKLSLHSGSDKFSVYPIAAEVAGDLVHVKTAGTSYLEAVRAIAMVDAGLFRKIMLFALDRYDVDRATYQVSADISKIPALSELDDESLPGLLEDFHARQALHVTFGSVLNDNELSKPFFAALKSDMDTYHDVIEKHFIKHIEPFTR